ncbi:MAG TPA: TIM barrel protein [Bryobacteraceae bacterium]|nr:TIM barrel protein [Bryobacteraceae bacterium]
MQPHQPSLSRRKALLGSGAALAAGALQARAAEEKSAAGKLKVAIFSKHLQFLKGEALARGAAEIGFDGVDLSVRKGGHVEPERVREELPKLVAIIRQHGLEVPMLTTDIADAQSPHAEDILRTMSELGIRHYRWGGFKYDAARPLARQLEELKPRVARLADLNSRYKASAMYHTHSGTGVVGASIWDLYIVLKEFDPQAVGVNYDIGHATVEGGAGGWINSFRIIGAHLRGVAVKDFLWGKDAKGNWKAQWTPLGGGMVRLPQFFGMLAASRFAGPLQLHFEYSMGGAESGKTALTIPKQEVSEIMKRDLQRLRGMLKDAALA